MQKPSVSKGDTFKLHVSPLLTRGLVHPMIQMNLYPNLIPLDSAEKLDALFERSNQRPVALIKHSNTCGISADILYQLGRIDGDIHVLTIQQNRPLSAFVAERIGHRHQSPQVFVLKDGKAIYHATHYAIDPDKIALLLADL